MSKKWVKGSRFFLPNATISSQTNQFPKKIMNSGQRPPPNCHFFAIQPIEAKLRRDSPQLRRPFYFFFFLFLVFDRRSGRGRKNRNWSRRSVHLLMMIIVIFRYSNWKSRFSLSRHSDVFLFFFRNLNEEKKIFVEKKNFRNKYFYLSWGPISFRCRFWLVFHVRRDQQIYHANAILES